MTHPLCCYECKNVYLMELRLFGDDGSGPLNYYPIFKCPTCNTWALATEHAKELMAAGRQLALRNPDAAYQWYSGMTALQASRLFQPPAGTDYSFDRDAVQA